MFRWRHPVTPEANVTAVSDGEIIQLGPVKIRVLEDGSRTDNRIGAVEITLPPQMPGPARHFHVMHDETFLVISGIVLFTIGEFEVDVRAGGYVVAPTGAAYTFANRTSEPAVFFNTFTPAYYVGYFRELGKLAVDGPLTPEQESVVRERYATVAC